MKLWGFSGNL